jgi:cytochrome b561
MSKRTIFWMVLFAAFAALATGFLMLWASSTPSWWGFPAWIFPFIGIHLGFTGAVLAFTKWYWKEEKQEE